MKPIVCISCEGSDTKIVVLSKTKEGVKLEKAFSVGMTHSESMPQGTSQEGQNSFNIDDISDDLSFDDIGQIDEAEENVDTSDVAYIASALKDFELQKSEFIPILTEPVVNYHIYEGHKEKDRKKLLKAIIDDISRTRNITVREDYIDFIELEEGVFFAVFIQGENACVNTVNSLAAYNNRRYYKIPTIKNAETSLAHHVAKTNKFFPEDYTLILYTGKDYSKLIFLKGNNLAHIGSTLDVGTQNLHTYDVYFSKILLEMENGNIPRLDNVILCGEDNSENLILSFYGTFPEANVSELIFKNVDTSDVEANIKDNLSSFAIPLAAGLEYFEEKTTKDYRGINILPRYIHENQKVLQFGWHSYIILPLIFAAAFYFTFTILSNVKIINDKEKELKRLTKVWNENQAITDEIVKYSNRIAEFDKTQEILDSAMAGTEVWNKSLLKIADFMERRRNFWITKMESAGKDEVKLEGYTLSKPVLTEFAEYNKSSLLQSIKHDQLREKDAYAYVLQFKLNNEMVKKNGP